MQWLEQSTSITVRIGPFVDQTDGYTAETGLTISQADIRLSKNGGDFAQTNDATGATHDENGWYYLTLDATDTNTLGRLDVAINESGALPVWREYMVCTSNTWDAFFGSTYLTTSCTLTASAVTTALSSGILTITRGDSLSAEITGLGDISGRSKLWFTVKNKRSDTDAQAIIQIEETCYGCNR